MYKNNSDKESQREKKMHEIATKTAKRLPITKTKRGTKE